VEIPDIRYARSGDVSIAYQVFGEGPDHVLIRLWAGDLSSMWEQPLLARYFMRMAEFSRVMIFDKRGMGMSDRAREVPTLEARMDDVRAVMDAAGSERAMLSGGGEGARMTALFAATYPERVSAVAFVNPSARGLWSPGYPWAQTETEWRRLLREVADGWGTQEFSDRLLREQAPSVADDEGFRAWWVTYLRRSLSPGAAVAFYRMMMESDVSDVLPLVRAQALVFHRDDQRGPAEYFASRIPHSHRIELPGLRDDHQWVRPESVEIVFRETERLIRTVGHAPHPDRVLATVLFTDIVGSTQRAVELGDSKWSDLLTGHNSLVRRELARFRGRELDTAGDGFLASFDGPARAILCACAVRDAVRTLGLELRSGLHTGECELVGDKLAGIAINTGARVAAKAAPGEVLVSRTVKDLVAGSGIEFEERGTHELKGLTGEWQLYAVSSAE
jgi:class 3 adenylate cyclase